MRKSTLVCSSILHPSLVRSPTSRYHTGGFRERSEQCGIHNSRYLRYLSRYMYPPWISSSRSTTSSMSCIFLYGRPVHSHHNHHHSPSPPLTSHHPITLTRPHFYPAAETSPSFHLLCLWIETLSYIPDILLLVPCDYGFTLQRLYVQL